MIAVSFEIGIAEAGGGWIVQTCAINAHKLTWIFGIERLQQNGLICRKHGRVHTNANCQRQHRESREPRMLHQHPNSETGVLKNGFDKRNNVNFTHALFQASCVAKAALRIEACLFRRHPVARVHLRTHG